MNNQRNKYLGIGLLTASSILLALFFYELGCSSAGEVAGALGGFIGGIIGAGGAVIAVYLAIASQKKEETSKVSDAVKIEVTTFVKYVIGSLNVCEKVVKNEVRIPLERASYIAKTLYEPIIYPAVADRVGLLPHPQATIEFYMRIAEAKAILKVMEAKVSSSTGATFVTAPLELVTPELAGSVAECLITALQLAGPIVADSLNASDRSQLNSMVQQVTLNQINESLASAKLSFPQAESFKPAS